MGIKFNLKLKDLKLEYFISYLAPVLKYFRPREKIASYEDLSNFIKKKSAWITQVTLYSYLKTRMGTKYVLMFDDDNYVNSINIAKWNIYLVSLQDLIFYTLHYLKENHNMNDTSKAKEIFLDIINLELKNDPPLPKNISQKGILNFDQKLKDFDWENFNDPNPFEASCLAMYDWAPIADELKKLDKKILMNSMFLRWQNIQKEFKKIIKI